MNYDHLIRDIRDGHDGSKAATRLATAITRLAIAYFEEHREMGTTLNDAHELLRIHVNQAYLQASHRSQKDSQP